MGMRDYLIEGVSGTGKTSVCKELQRRGYRAINGDRELAYQAIRKLANRRMTSCTSTTFGG
jgi:broad-specificity NMP kinase